MVPVFTDASSAILLEKIKLFDRLSQMVCIVFSPSVFKELTLNEYPDKASFKTLVKNKTVHVESLIEPDLLEPYSDALKLDCGEKETLCLYLKKRKGFILMDDGKAARFCHKQNLPFINALLVPKLFWYAGLMEKKDCQKFMNHLCGIGRYSSQVKQIAHELTLKDLSPFLEGFIS